MHYFYSLALILLKAKEVTPPISQTKKYETFMFVRKKKGGEIETLLDRHISIKLNIMITNM